MKYHALFNFVHNMVKIDGGTQFESEEVGFNNTDINFLRNQNKIIPVNTFERNQKLMRQEPVETVIKPVEEILLENDDNNEILENDVNFIEQQEEDIDFEHSQEVFNREFFDNMTKVKLDLWAKDHNINLDRRHNKDKMIDNLLEELNK